MKRFAVYGYGYNPNIPVCYVTAVEINEAVMVARDVLSGKTIVTRVIEVGIDITTDEEGFA